MHFKSWSIFISKAYVDLCRKIFTYKQSVKHNVSDTQKEPRFLNNSQASLKQQVKELSARLEELLNKEFSHSDNVEEIRADQFEQKELIENLQTDRFRDREEQKDVIKLLTGELSKAKSRLQAVEIESRRIRMEIRDLRNSREWNIATLTELPVNQQGKFLACNFVTCIKTCT